MTTSSLLRVTYSGAPFDLAAPDPRYVRPIDIAVVMARYERWGCHCGLRYYVAQHCVLASYNVPSDLAGHALLHDAAETYTGDIISPIKALLGDAFAAIEGPINEAICQRFGLSRPLVPEEVHQVDLRLRATERRDLLPPHAPPADEAEPYPASIFPWKWRYGLERFIERFEELFPDQPPIDRRLLPARRGEVMARHERRASITVGGLFRAPTAGGPS